MTCSIRLCRVLGLPAVCGGKMLGHVERAVLSGDGRALRGLVLRRGVGRARWADRQSVQLLGDVSVILSGAPVHLPRDAAFTLRIVKDESGLTLGRITDVWISPEEMTVTAMEITLGLMEDLRTGRRIVRQWAVLPTPEGGELLIPREEWEVTR